jgi:hypothetical protein
MSKEKKDNPEWLTQSEALQEVGMAYLTFARYCRILGIQGEREGRYTFYSRKQIDMFKQLLNEEVQGHIRAIMKLTGKQVKLF